MALRLPETEYEFKTALFQAAKLGAMEALEEANILKPYLKLREANRKYGPAVVKRWQKEGLITFIKDGNSTASIRIDRVQIEAVAIASNRATYLTTAERK